MQTCYDSLIQSLLPLKNNVFTTSVSCLFFNVHPFSQNNTFFLISNFRGLINLTQLRASDAQRPALPQSHSHCSGKQNNPKVLISHLHLSSVTLLTELSHDTFCFDTDYVKQFQYFLLEESLQHLLNDFTIFMFNDRLSISPPTYHGIWYPTCWAGQGVIISFH
jgi:hypothetical protein